MIEFSLYGEGLSQRMHESFELSKLSAEIPLFISASEAAKFGLNECAELLKVGGSITIRSGSGFETVKLPAALLEKSTCVRTELMSPMGLLMAQARLATVAPADGFQIFAWTDTFISQIGATRVLKNELETAFILFDYNNNNSNGKLVTELPGAVFVEHVVREMSDVSGTCLAGVVARTCARVWHWKACYALALFSSPDCEFVLEGVREDFRARYEAFFASESGRALFEKLKPLSTTAVEHRSVRTFLARWKNHSNDAAEKPPAMITRYRARRPVLSLFSDRAGVLSCLQDTVMLVANHHPVDDLMCVWNPRTSLESRYGERLRKALGHRDAATITFVDLTLLEFVTEDEEMLINVAKQATGLEVIKYVCGVVVV
jgi:hypothetical protein